LRLSVETGCGPLPVPRLTSLRENEKNGTQG
jgi:hypothetical protein